MTNVIIVAAMLTNCVVTEVKFENFCRITTTTSAYMNNSANIQTNIWEQWQTNIVYKTNEIRRANEKHSIRNSKT